MIRKWKNENETETETEKQRYIKREQRKIGRETEKGRGRER